MKTYQIKKIPSKMIYDEDTGRHIELPATFVIEDSAGKTILDIRNVAALERFINDLAKNDWGKFFCWQILKIDFNLNNNQQKLMKLKTKLILLLALFPINSAITFMIGNYSLLCAIYLIIIVMPTSFLVGLYGAKLLTRWHCRKDIESALQIIRLEAGDEEYVVQKKRLEEAGIYYESDWWFFENLLTNLKQSFIISEQSKNNKKENHEPIL